jgi:hypothetical protein
MRALRLLVSLMAVCGAAVAAPAASGEVECQGIDNCTTVKGPWVAVQGKTQPDQFQAFWTGVCPAPDLSAGSDWASSTPFGLEVYLLQASRSPIYGEDNSEIFVAENNNAQARSFQPLLGCVPDAAAPPRAAGAVRLARRISSHRLEARSRAAFMHRCRRGERVMSSGSAVGFFEERPPSARDLLGLSVRHRERGRGARVEVETGPRAGDDERVQLQVSLICRG